MPIPALLSILLLLSLTACGTDAVYLRHPTTGQTVQCGPYSTALLGEAQAAVEHERGCIVDYQRQGYERVMR